MESDESTGRPDDTWTEAQKAEYERLKAKWLAELPEEGGHKEISASRTPRL